MKKFMLLPVISLIFLSLFSTNCTKSGTGPSENVNTWEITVGDSVYVYSIFSTEDNDYIISGSKFSSGVHHIYAAKINSEGTLVWEQTFGEGYGISALQSDAGDILIGGYTGIYAFLIKLNQAGSKIWSRTYHNGEFRSLCNAYNGDILACGKIDTGVTGNDVIVTRMDATGNEIWSKTYGGNQRDWGSFISKCSAGGYIILGATFSYGTALTNDLYLIRIDENGNELWYRTFGGSGDDAGSCVRETSDGGFIISGYTYSFDKNHGYIIKTDSQGNDKWSGTYDMNYARTIVESTGESFVFAGGKDSDIYLVKVDGNGTRQWERVFGGEYFEEVMDMEVTSDGGYVLAGYTLSFGCSGYSAYIIKTDENGLTEF